MQLVDVPEVTPDPEQPLIHLRIVYDDRLCFGQDTLIIRPDAMVLNGLLSLRDRWATRDEIQDAGAVPVNRNTFKARFNSLREDLRELAGRDLIERQRPPSLRELAWYRLSPQVVFTDDRGSPDSIAIGYGVTTPIPILETYDGSQRINFSTSEDRRKVFYDLFRAYARHERLRVQPTASLNGSVPLRRLAELFPRMEPRSWKTTFASLKKVS